MFIAKSCSFSSRWGVAKYEALIESRSLWNKPRHNPLCGATAFVGTNKVNGETPPNGK